MRPPLPLHCRYIQQALAAFVFALSGAAPAASVTSTFDTSNEGWAIVAYPFRSHAAAPPTTTLPFDGGFGQPAGSVRVGDVFGETGIAAPAEYLGDMSGSYGGTLSYDIFLRFSDGVDYPAVVLNEGTMSLYYDAPDPVVEEWEHRVVPLTETGWRVSNAQTPATQEQFQAVLQNLVGLYIYTEWHTGTDDTSVDNISMSGGVTGVTERLPASSIAMSAWPNPFKRSTSISFVAPRAGSNDMQILNVAGQVVRRLSIPEGDSGEQTIEWDGMDQHGAPVRPGIYYGRVKSAVDQAVIRLTLLR